MPTSPSIYREGTISLTNGEAGFIGSGTAFLVNGVTGGVVWLNSGSNTYSAPILSISSDTEGELALLWKGPTVTNAEYVITRESALAADALFANNALVKVIRDLSLSAINPDGSGTLAERDALSPVPPVGYFWLRVELGYALELYRKETSGWSGPYSFS